MLRDPVTFNFDLSGEFITYNNKTSFACFSIYTQAIAWLLYYRLIVYNT